MLSRLSFSKVTGQVHLCKKVIERSAIVFPDIIPVSYDIRASSNQTRNFASGSNFNGDGNDDEKNYAVNDDPFGVSYEDGETNLGPDSELPPQYIRDPVSGKLTGETQMELSQEEKDIINMSDDEKEKLVLNRFLETWQKDDDKEDETARLIRREKIGLNVLGRKASDIAKSQGKTNQSDDLSSIDDEDSSAPLSSDEFKSLRAFLEKNYKTKITTDDISVVDSSGTTISNRGYDPDQDLAWVKEASKFGTATSEDAWLEDIKPSDLAPVRKLNRREASRIPKKLLHHNNLALLRRYITPGGQILNRVQSRLGAKDQRKIARLVKRARALGLIPFIGQWKFEDHGDLFADDIDEDREWEKQLKERGLIIQQKVTDE